MKTTGRRAWRKAAKKLRCKMGRRWRSQQEWVHSKRWSELVPDLEAHRAHIAGNGYVAPGQSMCLLMQRTWPEWWPFLTKQTNELPEV